MKFCNSCKVKIKGSRPICPLCKQPVVDLAETELTKYDLLKEDLPKAETANADFSKNDIAKNDSSFDPFPVVPLYFKQYTLLTVLTVISVIVYGIMLLIYLNFPESGLLPRYIFFALLSLWLLVSAIVRKRRNVAKSILYQLNIISLLLLLLDKISNWSGWSITYAIPLLACVALFAIMIAIGFIQKEFGDYVLYLGAVAIVGLIPLLFIIFAWVDVLWPSILSISLSSLMLTLLIIFRYRLIVHELKKRLHL
ncbi:MAG: hypothetical protein GX328_06245 [Clostridiaceae bacterium]|nr:hypothetical protein [Clostridiaceae bacterium]